MTCCSYLYTTYFRSSKNMLIKLHHRPDCCVKDIDCSHLTLQPAVQLEFPKDSEFSSPAELIRSLEPLPLPLELLPLAVLPLAGVGPPDSS